LDADFVPMPGILIRTIGFFSDPKIAIVQTPQSYLNCEPFRWNPGLERAMSDEAQAFYYDDQASRDAWGVSFFCGTSAVIRRSGLEGIGGFLRNATQRTSSLPSFFLRAAGGQSVYLSHCRSASLRQI
jgi:cellulose synthase/poly-beta-1,6-N-acetylglucosamine synthase-like glycosyltransferase